MPEISQEDLELLNKFKELGIEPDSISSQLAEHQELARANTLNRVVEITGYKPSLLSAITKDLQLKVEGDKAFVGDQPIEEYAEAHWSDLKDDLIAKGDSKQIIPYVKQPVKSFDANKTNAIAVVTNVLKRTYGTPKAATVN